MYAKCRDLDSVRLVFDSMEVESVIVWNFMIFGCVREGFEEEVLVYFKKMYVLDMKIDEFIYLFIFKCFALCFDVKIVGFIYCLVIKNGYEDYNFVSNFFVDMYGKRGYIDGVFKVFNKMRNKDVVLWMFFVMGYLQNGLYEVVLKLFFYMRSDGIYIDEFLFFSILGVCVELIVLRFGQQVYVIFIKLGNELFMFINNFFIFLYVKCGCMEEVIIVFDSM